MDGSDRYSVPWVKNLVALTSQFKKIFARGQENNLIRNCPLFQGISEYQLKKIIHSSKIIKYSGNQLVCQEDQTINYLYIIANGCIQPFTCNPARQKIPFPHLKTGDYFGEQIFIDRTSSYHLSFETIEKSTLIAIPSKSLPTELDKSLKMQIKRTAYQSALNIIDEVTGIYGDIQQELLEIKNPSILSFKNGDIIFNAGDTIDCVYLLLQGEVELTLSDAKTKRFMTVLMKRGHLFGNISTLGNKPQIATATATGTIKLLCIQSDIFKNYVFGKPIQKIITKIEQFHQLPMKGKNLQFIQKSEEDSILQNTLIDENSKIMSTKFLNKNFFIMEIRDIEPEQEYIYAKGENKIELGVNHNQLVRIKEYGLWNELPQLCQQLLDREIISQDKLDQFKKYGTFKITKKDQPISNAEEEIICSCMSVSRKQIQSAIDKGTCSFNQLCKETGACTVCMSCRYKLLELLGENPWMPAIMTKVTTHNHYINSYLLTPTNHQFKPWKASQHLILQVNMGDQLVERPYTITSIPHSSEARITVKKEMDGLFTQWLFEENIHQLHVHISQPQGKFLLEESLSDDILCFAGGIGITPFISFAKELTIHANKQKRMHIIYSAFTHNDVIFMEEFNKINKLLPNITIDYHATETAGLLTEAQIINAIQSLNIPHIYICGPEGFESLISNTLQKIRYDILNKVHIEQFVNASSTYSKRSDFSDLKNKEL